MVDHCDSGCCATWFAGWEKALESAETIPTAQEMPISHLASLISAPQLASFIPDHEFIADHRSLCLQLSRCKSTAVIAHNHVVEILLRFLGCQSPTDFS